MKSISIYKQGKLTNGPVIKPEAEAISWLQDCLAKNKFGKPERITKAKDCTPEEIASAIKYEDKVELNNEIVRYYHLKADFSVKIEDYAPPAEELRRAKYAKEIDPRFQEAVLDNMMGKPQKMQALLARYEQIKLEHPKNTSGVNDNGES